MSCHFIQENRAPSNDCVQPSIPQAPTRPHTTMALRIVALAASLALATAAAECDVCHLHYFHKVRTRATTHFSSYPCRHKTALGYPGTHNHLSPPPNVAGLTTAPPLLQCTGRILRGGVRRQREAVPRVPVRELLQCQHRGEVRKPKRFTLIPPNRPSPTFPRARTSGLHREAPGSVYIRLYTTRARFASCGRALDLSVRLDPRACPSSDVT